jgi:hypothetical protein
MFPEEKIGFQPGVLRLSHKEWKFWIKKAKKISPYVDKILE